MAQHTTARLRQQQSLRHAGRPDMILKFYLGTTEQHTVYEAILVGMIMGLYLIKTE